MSSPSGPSLDRRRERSRRTRQRVIEAAYRLFAERGYGVPLTEIAAAAETSIQNLYLLFTNKQNLVQAALQLAVLGDDLPEPPHERPWFRELLASPTPASALAIWVGNTLPIYARVAPLAGMFLSEPELAAMWAHSEQLRLEGFGIAMREVAQKGKFRAGLSLEQATDVMFVLLSPVVYREFVHARGWRAEDWGDWTSRSVAELLFA